MPVLRPFRPLRYGFDQLPVLDALITPSASDPADHTQVGEVHEHSVRRLVRGRAGLLASEEEPPFTHAARLLQRWKEEGVLVRAPRPALYVYEQEDAFGPRRGVVGLVRLSPLDGREVRPHEKTRDGAEGELLEQLRAMQTQVSMVMGLVPDEQGALAAFVDRQDRPWLSVRDGDGVENRLWVVEDPAAQLALAEALRAECAVIADGHHRYKTALAWRDEQARGGPVTRERPYDYVMMLLVSAAEVDRRTTISHRALPHLDSEAQGRLARLLDPLRRERVFDLDAAEGFLSEDRPSGELRFVLARAGLLTGVRVSPEQALASGLSEAQARVSAAVLDRLVLGPLDAAVREAGGAPDTFANGHGSGTRFSLNQATARDIAELAWTGGPGAPDAAFLLRTPRASQVLRVAEAGEVLPPKSTNFRPKPIKGLLLGSLRSF